MPRLPWRECVHVCQSIPVHLRSQLLVVLEIQPRGIEGARAADWRRACGNSVSSSSMNHCAPRRHARVCRPLVLHGVEQTLSVAPEKVKFTAFGSVHVSSKPNTPDECRGAARHCQPRLSLISVLSNPSYSPEGCSVASNVRASASTIKAPPLGITSAIKLERRWLATGMVGGRR